MALSFGFCKNCDISKPKCVQCKISMQLSAILVLRTDSSIDHAFMSLQNPRPNQKKKKKGFQGMEYLFCLML